MWAKYPPVDWITAPGVLLLIVDCIFVAVISRRLTRLLKADSRHPVSRALVFLTLAAGVIVASAWILSGIGALGHWGFLVLHAGLAGLLWLARPRTASPARPGPGLAGALFLGGDRRGRSRTNLLHRILLPVTGWLFVILLLYAFVLAIASFPGTTDSQTYRLSRVGFWLQERRLSMDFANDLRMFFMPVNTELFMLWLTGWFPVGYPLVNLAQYFGGLLSLLAVFELGRMAGLPRPARLLALALFVGMPIVFLQFSTSQSDLFTGGLFDAGLVFLWRALQRRSRSDPLLAGIALGLAFGAKGTPIYWIPGLAIWTGLLLWRNRAGLRRIGPALAAAGLVTLLVGGWKYADNWVRFGNIFADHADIVWMHQRGGSGRVARAGFVGAIHVWQLLEPNSNLPILDPVLAGPRHWLDRRLVSSGLDDNFAGVNGWNFHDIKETYRTNLVYEDIVSFGCIACLMAAIGFLTDLARTVRPPGGGARRRLAMGAALIAFFAVFFPLQNPNAWDYRLFVILAPFLAVLGAAALPVGRWRSSAAIAFLVIGAQIFGAFDIQYRNDLGGWRALFHPEREGSLPFFDALTRESIALPASVRTVAVALTSNNWLAPYFRLPGDRRFYLVPVDAVKNPADFLRRSKFDALVTNPGNFAAGPWPGIESRLNHQDGSFARITYLRSP